MSSRSRVGRVGSNKRNSRGGRLGKQKRGSGDEVKWHEVKKIL